MRNILSAKEAKLIDNYTVEQGMPSVVLMERAALAVAEAAMKRYEFVGEHSSMGSRALAVCYVGNNGADGIATARILTQKGFFCDVLLVGDELKATKEFILQKKIAEACGVRICTHAEFESYNIIIDAIFGIGLSRNVGGEIAELIERINSSGAYIISVDIPSGIDASRGQILGAAIRAHETVTFGFYKRGHFLFPGREYSGCISVCECGFITPDWMNSTTMSIVLPTYEQGTHILENSEHLKSMLPRRDAYSNKGDYGKILIIAGSKDITGAAFFSALSAYRMGTGIVTVLTHESINPYLKSVVPEAIVKSYTSSDAVQKTREALKNCTVAVIGPGLSTDYVAEEIVKTVFTLAEVPVIVDADALNIISANREILKTKKAPMIFTPHIGEMCRLSGLSKDEIKADIIEVAKKYAMDNDLILVLKDAATVVADSFGNTYINTSGNAGLAKGGSGDILTGIIAGMLAISSCTGNEFGEMYAGTCMGVYAHGLAGDHAAENIGMNSIVARDVIGSIPAIVG